MINRIRVMGKDRTLSTTTRRLLTYLQRHPEGVTRSQLHAVTGDIATIHLALDHLLAEGKAVEVTYRHTKGKPRRVYVAAEHFTSAMLEPEPAIDPADLPTARSLVLDVLRQHKTLSRSDIWRKAVISKRQIADTIEFLLAQGQIVESTFTDRRGGLVRVYALPQPSEDQKERAHAEAPSPPAAAAPPSEVGEPYAAGIAS